MQRLLSFFVGIIIYIGYSAPLFIPSLPAPSIAKETSHTKIVKWRNWYIDISQFWISVFWRDNHYP